MKEIRYRKVFVALEKVDFEALSFWTNKNWSFKIRNKDIIYIRVPKENYLEAVESLGAENITNLRYNR